MKEFYERYDHGLGLDGFWQLYEHGELVFHLHDDKLPKGLDDDDERLVYLVNSYEVHREDSY